VVFQLSSLLRNSSPYKSSLSRNVTQGLGLRRLDASGSGYGPVACSCEHGNEPSGSINGGEFLEEVSDYYILNKVSVPLLPGVSQILLDMLQTIVIALLLLPKLGTSEPLINFCNLE
jgi:hypothetical protein